MLVINNISFISKNKTIIKNVSFTMLPGSLLLIKGCNGIGKTTLLRIMAGLIKPSRGGVFLDGINIQDDIDNYHKDFVSYMDIRNGIKLELSILDNLKFWANIKDHQELIMLAMGQFNLLDIADIACYKLSSGLQRRVALARLIIDNSYIWILDEPDINLDIETKDLLQKLIMVKVREGGIVIIASHNIHKVNDGSILNMQDFVVDEH